MRLVIIYERRPNLQVQKFEPKRTETAGIRRRQTSVDNDIQFNSVYDYGKRSQGKRNENRQDVDRQKQSDQLLRNRNIDSHV